MIQLTHWNAALVLFGTGAPESSRLESILPEVFQGLLQPDVTPMVLDHYTVSFKRSFREVFETREPGVVGFDTFAKAAIKAGVVKTMMQIGQDPRQEMGYALAATNALETLWFLMRLGNTTERRILLEELLAHDALNVCLEKALNAPLAIHRQVALNGLGTLAAESFLGEKLTSKQASDIMVKMCGVILGGNTFYVEQFGNLETTWQSCLLFDSHSTPPSKSVQYAPRYFSMMISENATRTINGLLLRSPPPSQQFCYEILSHNPNLIDLLFQVAKTPRQPWYPDSLVNSMICESLILLFPIPREVVPGVHIKVDEVVQKQADIGWKWLIKSFKLLTAHPDWKEQLQDLWKQIESEKWKDFEIWVKRVKKDYHAVDEYSNKTLLEIAEYRGTCRSAIERLLTTLTHVAKECNLSDADILSFLPIGDASSQAYRLASQVLTGSDCYICVQSESFVFRRPIYMVYTLEEDEEPIQLINEAIIGPTSFLRLLTLLAERGVLDQIQQWKALPDWAPANLNISQLKRITAAENLRPLLLLSMKRLIEHREDGRKAFQTEGKLDYSEFLYTSGAELAAALIAFDESTKGKYKKLVCGARKYLVLCLGNAAEMALGQARYPRALTFAVGAIEHSKSLPEGDTIEQNIIDKNRRRLNRALAGLDQPSVS